VRGKSLEEALLGTAEVSGPFLVLVAQLSRKTPVQYFTRYFTLPFILNIELLLCRAILRSTPSLLANSSGLRPHLEPFALGVIVKAHRLRVVSYWAYETEKPEEDAMIGVSA
jgi:hypothetical protein